MASFRYKSLLLRYDNDDGTQSLRHQKLRIVEDTVNPVVAITPLIAVREVNSDYQYEQTNVNLRHLNVALVNDEVKVVIPYGPSNSLTAKSCMREILNSPGVIAGRYVGESEDYGDTANHNLQRQPRL